MSEPLILDRDIYKKSNSELDRKSSFVDFLIKEVTPRPSKSSPQRKEQKLTRHLSEILKILKSDQIHPFSYDWSLLGLLLSDLNGLVKKAPAEKSLPDQNLLKTSETIAKLITENKALKQQAIQFYRSYYERKLDRKEQAVSQPESGNKKGKSLFQFASLLRQINELEKKNLELINDNKEINQMVQSLLKCQKREVEAGT